GTVKHKKTRGKREMKEEDCELARKIQKAVNKNNKIIAEPKNSQEAQLVIEIISRNTNKLIKEIHTRNTGKHSGKYELTDYYHDNNFLPRTKLKVFSLSFLIHLQSNLWFWTPFATNHESYTIKYAGAELLRYYCGDWGAENHHGCTNIHELVIEILCFHNCRDLWKIDITRWIAHWSCISTSYHPSSLILIRMPMAELMTEGSWNPILDPNLIEWRNKLQLASKPSGQKPPQPKSGSRFASDSSMGRSMMDPNQIKLTKLCLNPPTAHQKVEKPIIEVLNKETNQFEACEYEIKEEDLQTLDPVQSNLKNSQSYHELKIMLLHAGDLIRTKSNWGTKSKDRRNIRHAFNLLLYLLKILIDNLNLNGLCFFVPQIRSLHPFPTIDSDQTNMVSQPISPSLNDKRSGRSYEWIRMDGLIQTYTRSQNYRLHQTLKSRAYLDQDLIFVIALHLSSSSSHDKLDQDDSSMDVNDHQIIDSIVKLILTLIYHLKFDTTTPNPHLVPKPIGLHNVHLLQSDDLQTTSRHHQIQFDILYQKMLSLVQVDDHLDFVNSLVPDLNQFYTIVDQILYLILILFCKKMNGDYLDRSSW
ncbi:hypothetical protein PSHT_06025, partial [Puccinia striiformis]